MLDKNIIQIHKNYDTLGPFERVCVERWKHMNPSWNYMFIFDNDLDEYIKDVWPEYSDQFNSYQGVLRSQFMRLAAVYRHGGLYADCDCYPVRPIESFVDTSKDSTWFELINRDGKGKPIIADYLYAARKGHPYVDEIIRECFRRSAENAHMNKTETFAKYMYGSSGIHCWSDIVVEKYNVERSLGCGGCRPVDMKENPDAWHVFHYSVESWIPNNRFERDGYDPIQDQRKNLSQMKEIYGI